MKNKMIIITLISLVGVLACGITYYFVRNSVLLTFAVTFGTCFYHLGVRLAVGHGIDAIYHNNMNHDRWWFQGRKWEAKFYKIIGVQKWKKHLPTYTPEAYDVKKHSIEEIIQATCQSEVVHEINMLLSFVPVIFTIWFNSLVAFIVTSALAFCFDGIFVIIQRYNRPRLRRINKLIKNSELRIKNAE